MIETGVYEDFLNPLLADMIEWKAKEMPLYINEMTGTADNYTGYSDNKTKDTIQFTHLFVNRSKGCSDWINMIAPVIDQLVERFEIKGKMFRCKMNVTVPSTHHQNGEYVIPHYDLPLDKKGLVALYYINDSDGETVFFESPDKKDDDGNFIVVKEVVPKKNTMVVFDSSVLHCNRPPKNSTSRWVINFLFSTDEKL